MAKDKQMELVEGGVPKDRKVRTTPPVLKATAHVMRIMDNLTRDDKAAVINMCVTHYGLNKPEAPNA